MNILPKKRWHVRTKENIARVRKDEAEAAEKEQTRQRAIKLAESEARTDLLRKKARQYTSTSEDFISLSDNDSESTANKEHVNFFKDVEDGTAEYKKTNKEYEKEKKDEKEKYEKQIGYLTYLGQDTNEALGRRSWYEELPSYKKLKTADLIDEGEIKLKQKSLEDPMALMKKYTKQLETETTEIKSAINKTKQSYDNFKDSLTIISKNEHKDKKSKRHDIKKARKEKNDKKHKRKHSGNKNESDCESKKKSTSRKRKRKSSTSSESTDELDEMVKKRKLEILRAERLEREKEERRRSSELLARLSGGDQVTKDKDKDKGPSGGHVKQKYNSQFNPSLAKQNFL